MSSGHHHDCQASRRNILKTSLMSSLAAWVGLRFSPQGLGRRHGATRRAHGRRRRRRHDGRPRETAPVVAWAATAAAVVVEAVAAAEAAA